MVISMKSLIMVTVFVAILAFAIAIAAPLIDRARTEDPADTVTAEPSVSPSSEEIRVIGDDDKMLLSALIEGEKTEVTMHDYLVGVLSAEMPASFEVEALRAQAVAARSYALYKMLIKPSESHPDTDVCGNSACCNAYSDKDDMLEKWGDSFDTYAKKIEAAVASTDGIYLIYEEKPVLAVFHSSSAGKTEASENVWGATVPYLKAADSPETEEYVPNYIFSVTIALSDFTDTIKAAYPEAAFNSEDPIIAENAVYTESGRLSSVTIGGVTVTGIQLRKLFDLRSAAISIELTDEAVILTTTGFGHGVGMSQYGANTLAKDGWDYAEILLHYYQGAELTSVRELT